MANCLNYDCNDPLGTHLPNDCGEELLGGGSGMLLLECNHQLTDPTSAAQVTAEIAAGRAHLLLNLKVGLDAPSPVEIDSNVAGGTTKLVTYDRTGTLIDGNVSANNVSFYNGVFGGRVFGGALVYIVGTQEATGGEKTFFIDAPVNFTGGVTMPNNNNEFITFNGTFKWRLRDMPSLETAPAGIFT
jgi:hypothetical protein